MAYGWLPNSMLNARGFKVLGKRLIHAIPVLLFATFFVFGLINLIPGDIAVTLAGENASDERIREIRHLYGLDEPFLVQYWGWLNKAVQGDLGKSLLTGERVIISVERSLPNTALIISTALLIACTVGIPLGIVSASRRGQALDGFIMTIASLGVAVPSFWLAMLLISFFALNMGWFPATGAVSFSTNPANAIHHVLLPALALAAGGIAEISRQLRTSLVEFLSSQQVRTLHAKGVSPLAILWRHGLRNVGINLITVISIFVNRLLSATVVIEAIFAIPGMGGMIVGAALNRDFPVVQGVVLVMALIVVMVNLVADVLYGVIDPRVN